MTFDIRQIGQVNLEMAQSNMKSVNSLNIAYMIKMIVPPTQEQKTVE